MDFKKLSEGIILSFVFLFAYGVFLSFSNYPYLAGLFLGGVSASPVVNNAEVLDVESNILPQGMEIDAQAVLSLRTDFTSHKVFLSKNADRKLSVASISKLMTAVVVLENYNMSAEQNDLLYAMLVGSDNAAAQTLSEVIGTENFVALMNKKAKQIGMFNSSFLNPTGLGLANFSTANDLAKLAEYILQEHKAIFGISSMKSFGKVINTDKLLDDSYGLTDRIVGGKTGETRTAGQCLLLVLGSEDGKSFLINVILNSEDRFGQMKKLINWADENI